MHYVDAGYGICLGVLAVYAASLVLRRRRLERADALRSPRGHGAGPVAAATDAVDGTLRGP